MQMHQLIPLWQVSKYATLLVTHVCLGESRNWSMLAWNGEHYGNRLTMLTVAECCISLEFHSCWAAC